MKKILLTSVLCVALVGCGSKDENKSSSNAQPVKQGKLTQDPKTCPTLSGTYGTGEDSIYIDTKVEGGQHEYAFEQGGTYIPADGTTRTSQDGATSLRVICGQNAVELFVKRPGQADMDLVLTDIGNNQIRAELGDKTATLTRQGAPAPIPAPGPTPAPAGDCPVLSGTFASDGGDIVVLDTQVQGNVFSYKFSADQQAFLPADGATHQIQGGSYRVACVNDGGNRSVTMNVNIQGRDPVSIQMTDLGTGNVKAVANGQAEMLHKR